MTVVSQGFVTGETTPWFTILAYENDSSANRTSREIFIPQGGGLVFCVIVADKKNTPTITPSLITTDNLTNDVTLWTAAAALSANGTYTYWLGPGAATGSLTQGASVPLARNVKVKLTISGASYDTTVVGFVKGA